MDDIVSENQIQKHLCETHMNYHFNMYECVPSTNDLAKERLHAENVDDISVIIANAQSAGRGRNGKCFISPKDGIYLSFVFTDDMYRQPFVSFAPCIAVCETMEKLFNIKPQIKWPNDILLNGKKVCGILTETQMSGDKRKIIIGIGINYLTNVALLPQDVERTAGSLSKYSQNVSRNEFIAELTQKLDQMYIAYTEEQYLFEYKKRTTMLGSNILVTTNKNRFHTKALDICSDGSLLIQKNDGMIDNIYVGDVSICVDGIK